MTSAHSEIKIKVIVKSRTFDILMENNQTCRELLKKLPVSIKMQELNSNEKYFYFDQPLSSNPSKVGKVNTGDIMLYGDNCIVIFYKSFSTSYPYTKIGKILNIDGLEESLGRGDVNVIFDFIK